MSPLLSFRSPKGAASSRLIVLKWKGHFPTLSEVSSCADLQKILQCSPPDFIIFKVKESPPASEPINHFALQVEICCGKAKPRCWQHCPEVWTVVRLVLTVKRRALSPSALMHWGCRLDPRDKPSPEEAPLPLVIDGGQLGALQRLGKVALSATYSEVFVSRKNSPG